jgi:hypothetical protein
MLNVLKLFFGEVEFRKHILTKNHTKIFLNIFSLMCEKMIRDRFNEEKDVFNRKMIGDNCIIKSFLKETHGG